MQNTKRKRRGKGRRRLRIKKITPHFIFEDGFGNSSESCGSSSSELSKEVASELSESVVSLVSTVGDTTFFECTGIFIESSCANATSVLTSASLVRCPDDDSKISDNLTIKVRLPNAHIVLGWLHHYDLMYVRSCCCQHQAHPDFEQAHLSFNYGVQFEPNCKVVAVGHCFTSGILTATSGIVIDSPSDELCELKLSRRKVNMARIGGPLIDFDGNFVGMNLDGGSMSTFVPMNKILECLGRFGKIRVVINQQGDGTQETGTTTMQKAAKPSSFFFDNIYGMYVINSFEKKFGDSICSVLSGGAASTMIDCVVSLASFYGDVRRFACIGVCINRYPTRILTSASLVRISGDENKTHDNLRIEVYLPRKGRAIGILKHYDFGYNVAVVEIVGFRSPCAIELEKHISFASNTEVVAVGCRFNEPKLMATKGLLCDIESKLDCRELRVSTCIITKAGIGGPLIDTCGNFVGMNFLHEDETPYLPREKIQQFLGQFDAKWHSAAETIDHDGPNSWPVPRAYWHYPPSRPSWYDPMIFPVEPYWVDNEEDLFKKAYI